MKGGARIAIGVGIGYVLGRTRKMRFALALAGAAMSRRSTGAPGELLERGTSLLKSSPELTQITDTVKGELLGAVRSAAVTAASHRIDALNERLQQRGVPDSEEDRGESQEPDSYEEEDERPDDESVADEFAEEEPAEEEPAEEEPTEDDEGAEDEYDEETEDEYGEEDSDRTRDEDAGSERRSTRPLARRTRTAVRRSGSRTSDRSSGSTERKTPSARRRRARTDVDEADEAPVRRTRR